MADPTTNQMAVAAERIISVLAEDGLSVVDDYALLKLVAQLIRGYGIRRGACTPEDLDELDESLHESLGVIEKLMQGFITGMEAGEC